MSEKWLLAALECNVCGYRLYVCDQEVPDVLIDQPVGAKISHTKGHNVEATYPTILELLSGDTVYQEYDDPKGWLKLGRTVFCPTCATGLEWALSTPSVIKLYSKEGWLVRK